MAGKVELLGSQANVTADVTVNFELRTTSGGAVAATSLNAVTANGNGTTVDFGSAKTNISMIVTSTGTPAAGTVTLQVSHDGVNWFATATTGTAGATVSSGTLPNGAWRYARAVLSALSGGTAPTVTTTLMAS